MYTKLRGNRPNLIQVGVSPFVVFLFVCFSPESSCAIWLQSNFHCIHSVIEILNVRKEIFTGIHESRIHHDSV